MVNKLLNHLETDKKTQNLSIFKQVPHLFQDQLIKPGNVPHTTHSIDTGNATPFGCKAYTRPYRDIELELEEIKKMLQAKVISLISHHGQAQ